MSESVSEWSPRGASQSLVVFLLLLLLTPVSLLLLVGGFVRKAARGEKKNRQEQAAKEGTVVLTGGKMSKSLQLARVFHEAGHRVILTEIEKYRLTAHRYSRSVDRFVALPSPRASPEGYESELVSLIRRERASHFVPVSSPAGALHDARVGEQVAAETRVIHYSSELTATLDDKFRFCELARSFGLPSPQVALLRSQDEIREFAASLERSPRFLLKSIVYDSVSRLNQIILPIEDLESAIAGIEISSDRPWVAQEFLSGVEFCTHTVADRGRILLHGCSDSSPFQVNYEHVEHPAIRDWVETFVKESGLTGQVSFDFIVDSEGVVKPVECNPRTHTAVTMFHDHPRLATAYLEPERIGAMEVVTPLSSSLPTYWLAHEVWRVFTASSLRESRHIVRRICTGVDAVYDSDDPLPFFLLHHLHIPALLLGNVIRGREWLRIDFNIGKLVESGGD